jgi:hypothetical protein
MEKVQNLKNSNTAPSLKTFRDQLEHVESNLYFKMPIIDPVPSSFNVSSFHLGLYCMGV